MLGLSYKQLAAVALVSLVVYVGARKLLPAM